MTAPAISVIIPTHSPDPQRLQRVLAGLSQQNLPQERWELLLIDNVSSPPLPSDLASYGHPSGRVLPAPRLGLTHARLAGINAARGAILVFVDDDNVLAKDYLKEASHLLEQRQDVAVAGGAIEGEFESPPPAWAKDHLWSLAVRDYGKELLVSSYKPSASDNSWPFFAPVGAGLVVRAAGALRYAEHCARSAAALSDRTGNSLGSAGDCELVMHAAFLSGAQVAYSPKLRLRHLIPAKRLTFKYHFSLAYQGGVSWGRFVNQYHFQRPIARASLLLRLPRAFWRLSAWRKTGLIRFSAAAGEFVGRAQSA